VRLGQPRRTAAEPPIHAPQQTNDAGKAHRMRACHTCQGQGQGIPFAIMGQVFAPAFTEQRRINEGRQCFNVALLCRNGDFFSVAYQNSNVYHFPNPDRKAGRRKAACDTPMSELLIFQTPQEEVYIEGNDLRDYALGLHNRTLGLLAETGTVSVKPKYPENESVDENPKPESGNTPFIASITVRNRP
jgi:hypothetical protein